ncbi:ABC transporter permease [Arthrobacter sulfonylureivorans]|uniref:ABC transporter permease n=1 Tax=Arthrobacter sulfonylureivorans TaxID=2486855 RepID=UPI0039E5A661
MSTTVKEVHVKAKTGQISGTAGRVGSRLAYSSGLLVVLLLLWQLGTALNPSPFFPTPLKIGTHAWTMFFSTAGGGLATEAMTVHTFQTLGRVLLGFVLGSVTGVLVGTAIGLYRILRDVADPVVEFLRSIPATATLPLFIVLLGGEDSMRVAFIAYGISWFVLINTANGVGSIHPTQLAMGKAFRLSKRRQLTGIILPAALPKIFAGLRLALTGALMFAIVSEFMLSTNGIGFQLIQSQARFQILDMWSWMLLLAVLGLLLNTMLEITENRLLAWHRLARS